MGLYDDDIMIQTVEKEWQHYTHIKDHLGSVRSTIDKDGQVVSRDDYYPYGLPMPNGRSVENGNPENNRRFTSHQYDEDFGVDLTYAGARYLDPEIGVWMSVDPLAAKFPEWSPYNYTFGNPLRFIDPDGRAPDDYYRHADGNVTVVRNGQPNRYFNENTETGVYDNVKLNSNEGRKYLDENQLITKDLAYNSATATNREVGMAGGSLTRVGMNNSFGVMSKYVEKTGSMLSDMGTALGPLGAPLKAAGSLVENTGLTAQVISGNKSWQSAAFDVGLSGVFSAGTIKLKTMANVNASTSNQKINDYVLENTSNAFENAIDEPLKQAVNKATGN